MTELVLKIKFDDKGCYKFDDGGCYKGQANDNAKDIYESIKQFMATELQFNDIIKEGWSVEVISIVHNN
jgi:hypothetical protein